MSERSSSPRDSVQGNGERKRTTSRRSVTFSQEISEHDSQDAASPALENDESIEDSCVGDDLDPAERVEVKPEQQEEQDVVAEDDYEENAWKRQRALSLDGGGIRGLWQLYMLRELMQKVKELEREKGHSNSMSSPFWKQYGDQYSARANTAWLGKKDEYYPCHYFDYIVGTSTGGLIAILLGRLHLSIDEAIKCYKDIWTHLAAGMTGRSIFSRLRKSSLAAVNAQQLETALKKIVSEKRRSEDEAGKEDDMVDFAADSEMVRTVCLATEVESNNRSHKAFLFRSYPYENAHRTGFNISPKPELDEVSIWQVARATSAAPMYFSSLRVKGLEFMDGTLYDANPALEIYDEIKSLHHEQKRPLQFVVSIGSGNARSPARKTGLLRHWAHLNLDIPARRADVEGVMRGKSKEEKFGYYRFEGPADTLSLQLDRWTKDGTGEKTFGEVKEFAHEYVRSHGIADLIQVCASELVRARHLRAKTARWERFAMGIYYTCPMCEGGDQPSDDQSADENEYKDLKNRPQDRRRYGNTEQMAAKEVHHRSQSAEVITTDESFVGIDLTLRKVKSAGSQYKEWQPKRVNFDARNDLMFHLIKVHGAPRPHGRWKKAVNTELLQGAHTTMR